MSNKFSLGKVLALEGINMNRLKDVTNELKEIKTIDLASKATISLEKIFWFVVGVAGIIWATWFIPNQFKIWMNNPKVVMKDDVRLQELEYPAVTIVTPGTSKYGIAERIGNYIDPKNVPNEVAKIQKLYVKCAMIPSQELPLELSDSQFYDEYFYTCIDAWRPSKNQKLACKVKIVFLIFCLIFDSTKTSSFQLF